MNNTYIKKHQSTILAEQATVNLEAKINVLTSWIKNGLPWLRTDEGKFVCDERSRQQLDYFPSSMRAFNGWNGSQNCTFNRSNMPKLNTNNQETLNKRSALLSRLQLLLDGLKKQAQRQISETKSDQIKALKDELNLILNQLKIVDHNNIELRRNLHTLKATNIRLDKKAKGDSEEFHRRYKEMSEEITILRIENASLVSQLSKVRGIRVSHEKE